MICDNCIHAAVCEKLEEHRDPLYFENAITKEVECSYFEPDVGKTSFQEDLDFFVNDCTDAQLDALYRRVREKLKEKGLIRRVSDEIRQISTR